MFQLIRIGILVSQIIDMYRNQGEGLNHYARILKEKAVENEWIYGDHYAPHDIQVRELGSGAQTRLEIAKDLGIPFTIVPNLPISEGVELTRGMFPRLWIDSNATSSLKLRKTTTNSITKKLNIYSNRPVHDWSSHTMDALRYLAVIQNKRRHKGMTEEDADRMQAMYQFRHHV